MTPVGTFICIDMQESPVHGRPCRHYHHVPSGLTIAELMLACGGVASTTTATTTSCQATANDDEAKHGSKTASR